MSQMGIRRHLRSPSCITEMLTEAAAAVSVAAHAKRCLSCQSATYEGLHTVKIAPDVLLLHVTDRDLQTPGQLFRLCRAHLV